METIKILSSDGKIISIKQYDDGTIQAISEIEGSIIVDGKKLSVKFNLLEGKNESKTR
jgi:hypothetical protein